jgi:hypothetical protein
MAKTKKSESMQESNGPGASKVVDFDAKDPGQEFNLNIDQKLVDSLEAEIATKKEEIRSKVYAISCDASVMDLYEKYMTEEAEWNSTEALGIVEINRQIQKIKKEGIKDGVIYMGALPLEASHYFISKAKGNGVTSARNFVSLYKAFDQALTDTKQDAAVIKNLEQQLNAAMQGISLG